MWNKWVLALLGLVVVAVPFLGLSVAAMTWTLVVVGVVTMALSLWSLSNEADLKLTRTRFQHSN